MGKWLVAIIFGLAVVAAVYLLRENIVSAPAGGGLAPISSGPEPSEAPAPSTAAYGDDSSHDMMASPAASADASTSEPLVTIPPGSANTLISVDFPWARAAETNMTTTAIYMLLTNNGESDAYLLGARSSDAARVEIHQTVVDGAVVSMKPVKRLDLEPGVPTALELGGLHLMVIGLKHPLKDGDVLDLTLDFGSAGEVSVKVPVGEPEDTDSNPVP